MPRVLVDPRFLLGFLLCIVSAHAILSFSGSYWTTDGTVDRLRIDTALHAAGGFWIAALSLYAGARLYGISLLRQHSFVSFIAVLGIVALVGVLWEFFEFGLDTAFGSAPHIPRQQGGLADTMEDLAFDLVGGVSAAGIALWKRIRE